MPAPPQEKAGQMSPEEIHHYGKVQAYEARWQKVIEPQTELEADLLEAEVLWGQGPRNQFLPLIKLERELMIAVQDCLMESNPNENNGMKEAIRERKRTSRDVLYAVGEDKFDDDVNSAIALIEQYLKPHLKK